MTSPTDTSQQNKSRLEDYQAESLWLFGYGSLIFKTDFDFLEKRQATIRGWERRFWQGSHDHRGTPEQPGRVVTLIESVAAECVGMAYRIETGYLQHLDEREKNGYLRFFTDLVFVDGAQARGLVYIATAENRAYLGAASERQIALQISQSAGASGGNADYLFALADCLRGMAVDDRHVFAIERVLKQIM